MPLTTSARKPGRLQQYARCSPRNHGFRLPRPAAIAKVLRGWANLGALVRGQLKLQSRRNVHAYRARNIGTFEESREALRLHQSFVRGTGGWASNTRTSISWAYRNMSGANLKLKPMDKVKTGERIIYNDRRPGHERVMANVLEFTEGHGMLVQFDDRSETTYIQFSDSRWMDFLGLVEQE